MPCAMLRLISISTKNSSVPIKSYRFWLTTAFTTQTGLHQIDRWKQCADRHGAQRHAGKQTDKIIGGRR